MIEFLKINRKTLHEAALSAGALILKYAPSQQWDGDVQIKKDGTPVTVVDRLAEDIIYEALQKIAPDIPMIGEERFSLGEAPKLNGAECFWLVDALDGTKDFIAGTGEYTVNIALIENGDPIYGLIYAPEKNVFFEGGKGLGAFSYDVEKGSGQSIATLHNEQALSVRPLQKELILVTSARQRTSSKLKALFDGYKIIERKYSGSSIKFGMIAAGDADLYPRLGYTSEWDTAAGDAILRQSGGVVIDTYRGRPMLYGQEQNKFLNPHFVALSRALYDQNPDYFWEAKDAK